MKGTLEANTSLASWFPKKDRHGAIGRRDALGNLVGTPSQLFSVDFDDSRGDMSLQSKALVDMSTGLYPTTDQPAPIHPDNVIHENPKLLKTKTRARSKPVVKLFTPSVKQSLSRISKDFHLRSTSKDLFKRKLAQHEPTSPTRDSVDDTDRHRTNSVPTRLDTQSSVPVKPQAFKLIRRDSLKPYTSKSTEATIQTLRLQPASAAPRNIHIHAKKAGAGSQTAWEVPDHLEATVVCALSPRHGMSAGEVGKGVGTAKGESGNRVHRGSRGERVGRVRVQMKQALVKEGGEGLAGRLVPGLVGVSSGGGVDSGAVQQQLNFLTTNTGKASYRGYVKAHETMYGLPIHISPYFRRFDKPAQSNTASSSNLENISSLHSGDLYQYYTSSQTYEAAVSDHPYHRALKHYRWSSATLEDLPHHSDSTAHLKTSTDTLSRLPESSLTPAVKATQPTAPTDVPALKLLADLDPQLSLLRRSVASARKVFNKPQNWASAANSQGLLKRLSQGNRFNPVESIGKITGQIQESTIELLVKKRSVSKGSPDSLNTSKNMDGMREISPRVKISGGSIAELVSVIGGLGQSFAGRRLPESLKVLPENVTKTTDNSDSKPSIKSVPILDINAGLVGTKIHKPLFGRLKLQPNSQVTTEHKQQPSTDSGRSLPGVSRLSSQRLGDRITSFSPLK